MCQLVAVVQGTVTVSAKVVSCPTDLSGWRSLVILLVWVRHLQTLSGRCWSYLESQQDVNSPELQKRGTMEATFSKDEYVVVGNC